MGCKGICIRYKANKPGPSYDKWGNKIYESRYYHGQKRCPICEVYFVTTELNCQCCGMRLKTRPKNSKAKERFRMATGMTNRI